jgi:hypothetical protein
MAPIATPMASKKLHKKLYKLTKKGASLMRPILRTASRMELVAFAWRGRKERTRKRKSLTHLSRMLPLPSPHLQLLARRY